MAAIEGAACQLPASLYLPISQGANVRNSYVGDAARRGILQAIAVDAGMTAPTGAIEAYDKLVLGGEGTEKALAPCGEWLIEQGYLKPHAAVRHVHYGAEAAIRWRRRHGVGGTKAIRALDLAVYPEAVTYCGNRAPVTAIQAQFSLSYGIAWALGAGDLAPDAYNPSSLDDAEVGRLEALVTITGESKFADEYRRAARLRVTTSKGVETMLVDAVPGDPDMPLSARDVESKFIRFTAPVIGGERAAAMAAQILQGPLTASLNQILTG